MSQFSHPPTHYFIHLHRYAPVFSKTTSWKVLAVWYHQLVLAKCFDLLILLIFTSLLFVFVAFQPFAFEFLLRMGRYAL